MSVSITRRLIAKDLYLYRWFVAAALLAGGLAVILMPAKPGDGDGVNLGFIVFITAVIALGIFIALYGLLKERQDKSLQFVLGLPLSAAQYAAAKVAAALIAFGVPWVILTLGITVLTFASDGAPDGAIPPFLAMMAFFLANFCLLLALVLATMSEAWAIAGILITNTAVPVVLGVIFGLPGIAEQRQQEALVWTPEILAVIVISVAVAVVSLALALYIRSRKRDIL